MTLEKANKKFLDFYNFLSFNMPEDLRLLKTRELFILAYPEEYEKIILENGDYQFGF